MKLSTKVLPLVAFFLTFFLGQYWIPSSETRLIYAACAMAGCATLIYCINWYFHRKIDKVETIFVLMVGVFAVAAVAFQNGAIYQWKPTVLFAGMAAFIFINAALKNKSLMAHMMADNIKLSPEKWRVVDLMNAWFFVLMAVANAAVLKLCTVETWVNFKVFGSLALSFVFVIFLAIYLSRHIEESDVIKPNQ